MTKNRLEGQRIVVTGAGRGLGRRITETLVLNEGAMVMAVDLKEDLLKDLRSGLPGQAADRLTVYPIDLRTADAATRIFHSAMESGGAQGLVNNAGLTHFGPAESAHLKHYEAMFEVNFLASMRLSLLFLDAFKATGQGRILNISSVAGSLPVAYQNVYSASKHALQCFSEALQEELKRHPGISVGVFAPGGLATAMVEESGLAGHFAGRRLGFTPVDKAASLAVESLVRRRSLATTGALDSLCIHGARLIPRRWVRALLERLYRPKGVAA